MDKLLSIIIPCYNTKEYIARCINSIVFQNKDFYELIIVDDGSNDGTEKIIENYKNEDTHIIHIEHSGNAEARNIGLAKARGEYIWMVDSDDFVSKDSLTVIEKNLNEYKPDILRFSYHNANIEGGLNVEQIYDNGLYEGKKLKPIRHDAVRNAHAKPFFIWLHVYKRELIKDIRFYETSKFLSVSNSFNQRVYAKADSLLVIDDILYTYKVRRGSVTTVIYPYINQAMSLFKMLKNEFISMNKYSEYENDIKYAVLCHCIIGDGEYKNGALHSEFAFCSSKQIADERIKKVLESDEFADLLSVANTEYSSEIIDNLYPVFKKKDIRELYNYVFYKTDYRGLIGQVKEKIYSLDKIKNSFSECKPKVSEYKVTHHHPAYLFRDESWEHIRKFQKYNDIYLWDEAHNSDFSRLQLKDKCLHLSSKKKENNWNCLFYRKYSENDFSLSFRASTENVIDEIQISFNCMDLTRRCRFMIRKCKEAVFEVVDNAIFYNYLYRKDFKIETGRSYLYNVVKTGNNYQFYIDDEMLFSIEDKSGISFGKDIAIILYNQNDEQDIDVSLFDIEIKTSKEIRNRIGILSYHKSHNYGAYLQAYSLLTAVRKSLDVDCEIIDYRTEIEEKVYTPKLNNISGLESKFYKHQYEMFNEIYKEKDIGISDYSVVSDNVEDFKRMVDNRYDLIICGSDEIWRVNSFRGFPTAYWLWGNLHARKVACAVSCGTGFNDLSIIVLEEIIYNLRSFSLLTCRDTFAYNSISSLTNKNVEMLCDPTFTYNHPQGLENLLGRKVDVNCHKKTVLVLLDSMNNDKYLNKIKKDLGDQYNLISMFRYQEGLINIEIDSPFEWVEIIREADFVITNLYHGTIFSILMNTPFLSICEAVRKGKLMSLLKEDVQLKRRAIEGNELLAEKDLKQFIETLSHKDDYTEFIEKKRKCFSGFLSRLEDIINLKNEDSFTE